MVGIAPFRREWAQSGTAVIPQRSGLRPASLAEPAASAKALGVDDTETPPESEALASEHLDVYATKKGQFRPVALTVRVKKASPEGKN